MIHRQSTLLLALVPVLLAPVACARSISIAPLPVHGERAADVGPPPTPKAEPAVNAQRYWSAYFDIEALDIPSAWGVQRGDFILISARVKIPLRTQVIERDFPLFLVEHGQVQVQSGVDLLRKMPISDSARDQIALTIEVRYFKGARYLDIAKKILKEAATAAKPLLSSYPAAAQIVGAAIPMLDRVVPESRQRTPSSYTMMIDSDRLPREGKLLAFALSPLVLPVRKPIADVEQDKRDGESHSLTRALQKIRLIPCSDFPSRLCDGGQLTAPLSSSGTPTPTSEEIRQQLARNDLWISDLARREAALRTPQQQQQSLPPVGPAAKAELDDIARQREAATKERDDLKKRLSEAPEVPAGGTPLPAASDPVEVALYQLKRIVGVYVTLDFRSYDTVFDPMLFLRDARANCSALSGTSIKQAQDYLAANEELFALEDVDLARRQFALGQLYIDLREAMIKRDHATALEWIDRIYTDHWALSPDSPTPEFRCLPGDPLCAHYNALYTCAVNLSQSPALSQLTAIYAVNEGLSWHSDYLADTCPNLADDAVFRLDLLDRVLRDFSTVAGGAYEYPGVANPARPRSMTVASPILRLADAEAHRLLAGPAGQPVTDPCNDPGGARSLARRVTLACADCWKQLETKCGAHAQVVRDVKSRREQAVRAKLSNDPGTGCAAPPGP